MSLGERFAETLEEVSKWRCREKMRRVGNDVREGDEEEWKGIDGAGREQQERETQGLAANRQKEVVQPRHRDWQAADEEKEMMEATQGEKDNWQMEDKEKDTMHTRQGEKDEGAGWKPRGREKKVTQTGQERGDHDGKEVTTGLTCVDSTSARGAGQNRLRM